MLPTKPQWMFLLLLLACPASAGAAAGQKKPDPQKQVVPIDRIIAVVNDDVITRLELDIRLDLVVRQLQKQGTPLPAPEVLEKQLLERMIVDRLQSQFARETGVRVDDTQLDKSLQRIAQENNFPSLADFRAKLEEEGVDFGKFREEIRGEIVASRLREREVDSKLVVGDSEVDNYLATQSRLPGKGDEYRLSHILVLVPEQAGAEKIQASRQRIEQALSQLQGGAEFAQVAAGSSDAKDALQGGNMGWRPADRVPALFLDALQKMRPGEISPVLRSPNGFHILKLAERRSKDVPVMLKQTRVRHILIKTSEIMPESDARSRLLEIRQNIVEAGADFAEQAKRYSEDGSAMHGGDLGWISPGETVPEFEEAINALRDGQVSSAVHSGFGWHLIQVLERRNADVSAEQKKMQARMAIRGFKSDEAYQDWLRQLRDRAYVEYRIGAAGKP
ncbi:MAG: peptidylprolyl isomerase [Nitrosomonadales bacterium]|nr:peptidylprolyl isomerase [Nitrosomonadales bacterium]